MTRVALPRYVAIPTCSTPSIGPQVDPSPFRCRAVGDVLGDECGVEVHVAEPFERNTVLPNVRTVLDGIELESRHPLNCKYKILEVKRSVATAAGEQTSEQLRSDNAQTAGKTGHHQGPEDEARHHEIQPCTVCKTSIPVQIRAAPPIFRNLETYCQAGTAIGLHCARIVPDFAAARLRRGKPITV
jgi:hypothetical protein